MSRRLALGIETTGSHLGLALHDLAKAGAPAIARVFEAMPGKQSEFLFPSLTKLLKSNKLRREQVAAIMVDHGPGSFTGVRLGVAVARALAQSLAIPVIGVSSLEALAWGANPPEDDAVVIARLPALAGEAYHAAYRRSPKGWSVLSQPAWTTEAKFDRLVSRYSKGPLAIVLVERANGETFTAPKGAAIHRVPAPDPSSLVSITIARYGPRLSAKDFPVDAVAPVYLQPSWAERKPPKEKKR